MQIFLITSRKIFQIKDLRSTDPRLAVQNLQNKEFRGKLFQDKELRWYFPIWDDEFFSIELRKILIEKDLGDGDRSHAPQNIVKEGLTRKIFQLKGLASPEN